MFYANLNVVNPMINRPQFPKLQTMLDALIMVFTSSTAQGGGGSFKNRKPIGEVGCCESGMAKRIH
jgi:hypothetical protein